MLCYLFHFLVGGGNHRAFVLGAPTWLAPALSVYECYTLKWVTKDRFPIFFQCIMLVTVPLHFIIPLSYKKHCSLKITPIIPSTYLRSGCGVNKRPYRLFSLTYQNAITSFHTWSALPLGGEVANQAPWSRYTLISAEVINSHQW